MATTKGKQEATTAFAWVDGARPPVYEKRLVRDRHTNQLVDVDMNPELPPIDEGSDGTLYVIAKGEVLPASHPAVVAKPWYFTPVK